MSKPRAVINLVDDDDDDYTNATDGAPPVPVPVRAPAFPDDDVMDVVDNDEEELGEKKKKKKRTPKEETRPRKPKKRSFEQLNKLDPAAYPEVAYEPVALTPAARASLLDFVGMVSAQGEEGAGEGIPLVNDMWYVIIAYLRRDEAIATIGRLATVAKWLGKLIDHVFPERFHALIHESILVVSLLDIPLLLIGDDKWAGTKRGAQTNDELEEVVTALGANGLELDAHGPRLTCVPHSAGIGFVWSLESTTTTTTAPTTTEEEGWSMKVDILKGRKSLPAFYDFFEPKLTGARPSAAMMEFFQEARACVKLSLSPLMLATDSEWFSPIVSAKTTPSDNAVLIASMTLDTRRYGRYLASRPAAAAIYDLSPQLVRRFSTTQQKTVQKYWRTFSARQDAHPDIELGALSNHARVFPVGAHVPWATFDAARIPLYDLQAAGLKVAPHHYQTLAVSWMMHFEERVVKARRLFSYVAEPEVSTGSMADMVLVDLGDDQQPSFQPRNSEDAQTLAIAHVMRTRGGVLADEMGLGKTLELLALIALTRPAVPTTLRPPSVSSASLATLFLETRATLFVVPNGLVSQVLEQVAATFGEHHFRVLVFGDVSAHALASYDDVRCADIVFITTEFLHNGYGRVMKTDYAENVARTACLQEHRARIFGSWQVAPLGDEALAAERSPVLELFRWQRVIVDEAADLITPPRHKGVRDTLGFFALVEAHVYWAVTATPGDSIADVVRLADFLRLSDPDATFDEHHFAVHIRNRDRQNDLRDLLGTSNKQSVERGEFLLARLRARMRCFVRACVWRQTQSNVERQVARVHFAVAHRRFALAEDERLCYEAARILHGTSRHLNELLITQTGTVFTPDKTRADFPGRHETEIEWAIRRVQSDLSHASHSADVARAVAADANADVAILAHAALLHARADIERIAKRLEELAEAQTLARSAGDAYETIAAGRSVDVAAASGILLDSSSSQQQQKGPWNAQRLRELYEAMVERHGTKAASAIVFLQRLLVKDRSARVLVFSRREPLFRAIETAFGPQKVIALQGNIFTKRKRRDDFIHGTAPIMLLDLARQSSGLHLIQASHVLLLDPVRDAADLAREHQAIGRAARQGQARLVQVTRLVIADTVEEPFARGHHAATETDFFHDLDKEEEEEEKMMAASLGE